MDVPDSFTMVKHFFILMMCEDFFFHLAHRLAHCKHKYFPIYQLIHKQHHEFNHPVSIASEYAHPIEFVIANFLPFFSGMLILGPKCHLWTMMQWGGFRILETHDGHSGYEFPWSIFRLIPFGTDATYHNFHHSKNVGNYSSFMTIWDTIFDSNKDYYEC